MMFTFFTRIGLNLIMAVSLIIGSAGGHVASTSKGGISASTPAPSMQQTGFGTQFTYDGNGNVLSRTNPNGAITRYQYDAGNRLITILYPDKSSVKFTFDSLGQRTSMTDSVGKTSYEYDIHGRLVKVTDPNKNTLLYAYDPRGLLTQLTYPDGNTISYTWGANGQLMAVQDTSGITKYEYDTNGSLNRRILPNGITTVYDYDDAYRMKAMQYMGPQGNLLLGFEYKLDAEGNRIQVTRLQSDNPTQVTQYEYNALKWLTKVTYPDGEVITFEYDATGNRISMNSSIEGITAYTYNGFGQLAALEGSQDKQTFRYDANGNMIERSEESKKGKQIVHYTWDYENQLKKMDDGQDVVEYVYDGDGLLSQLTVNGISRQFAYDIHSSSPKMVAEQNNDGYWVKYPLGWERLGEIGRSAGNRFYLSDDLGSIVGLTDNMANLLDTYSYDAFGLNQNVETILKSSTSIPWAVLASTSLIGLQATDHQIQLIKAFFQQNNDDNTPPEFGFGGQPGDRTGIYLGTWGVNTPNRTGSVIGRDGQYYHSESPYGTGLLQSLGSAVFEELGIPVISSDIHSQYYGQSIDVLSGYSGGVIANANTVLNDRYSSVTEFRAYGFGMVSADFLQKHGVLNVDYYVPSPTEDPIHFFLAMLPNTISAKDQNITVGWKFTVRFGPGGGPSGLNIHFNSSPPWNPPVPSNDINNQFTSNPNENNGGTSSSRNTNNVNLANLAYTLYPDMGSGTSAIDQKKYFYPPICPPPLCDNGDGGGGAAVGGVLLDLAAKVLVNLNEITGASFDPKTGQVTLIGKQDLTLPPMKMDDLVVAIRTIYGGGEYPGVTMFPVDPSMMKDTTQNVEYIGQTQNTNFGYVMFEADRYLKSLAGGEDTITKKPVTPNVPGYKSESDLVVQLNSGDIPWHRNWFLPGEVILKKSADGHSMVFDKATIKLESKFIKFLPGKPPVDVPGSSPVTEQFTSFITQHYDEFAHGKTELQQLKQLAAIVGFVRWLHDSKIPVDLSWVNDYQVKKVDTPDNTPGIKSATYMGGVGFTTENTYIPDPSNVAGAMAKKANDSRPADFPLSWNFDDNGETLTAVAFNVSPTQIVGGYASSVTDLVLPVSGGQSVSFTRQYNSLDLGGGPLGSGWSQVLPKLNFQSNYALDNSGTFSTQAFITTGTTRQTFTFGDHGLFNLENAQASSDVLGVTSGDPFTPQSVPDGYYPQPGLPGQPAEILNDQKDLLKYDGFALLKQDGSALAFDPSGRIVAQRDSAGQVLTYKYDANLLTAITNTAGHSLQFTYDTSGLLTGLTASDGQSIHYTYDGARNLLSVTDETGAKVASYAYDTNGRLDRITDQNGRVSEIAYDGLGRAVSTSGSSGSWTAQYDDQTNTVKLTNANGGVITRQYDDQNRLLSEADPVGKKVEYQYDEKGQMTALTDRNGNKTTFSYDEFGNLAETVSPLGEKTTFWRDNKLALTQFIVDPAKGSTKYKYDERGRLTGMTSGFNETYFSADGVIHYNETDPQSITYSYDAAGNLASVQDASGNVTHYSYDDLGNLTSMQLPGSKEVRQTYDEHSNLTGIADATGYQVNLGYDSQGQLTTVTTPAGQTQYQYTNGLITAVTDPLNHTIQYSYDAAGRLATVTEPGGGVTTYEYDASGNLVTIQDALGKQTQFQYDAAGRVIGVYYLQANGSGVPRAPSTQPASNGSPHHPNYWLLLGLCGGLLLIVIVIIMAVQRIKRKRNQDDSSLDGMSSYFDDGDPV